MKNLTITWTNNYKRILEELKEKFFCPQLLKFCEFGNPFKVHTNASDFAIGQVFKEDGRPIALDNKKLDDIQTKWQTHKEKMFVVVNCFKTLQHYLGLIETKVFTHNVSLKYFKNQTCVLAKKLRWYVMCLMIS